MSKKVEKAGKNLPTKLETTGLFKDMEKRLREMENRFEDLFSKKWLQQSKWDFPDWQNLSSVEFKTPKVDIVDRKKDILVRADIPGVKKENLDVTLTDNTITIKGSTSEEKKEEDGDYYRSETMKGSFSRTMSLPSDVNSSEATSTFKKGVLEVIVPKLEKAKRHSVKIS